MPTMEMLATKYQLSPADAEAAARLVTLGLRPKQLPARDADYAELVRRYGADDDFKGMVNAVAAVV